MYKKGDIVKIRSDLKVGWTYGDCGFIASMLPMLNKKVKIKATTVNHNDMPRYQVYNSNYYWSAEMFESVKPKLFKLL